MIERIGHALTGWLVSVNLWTALLLAAALLIDRALARRARASLRIALYAPIALRVLLPLSWSFAAPRAASAALRMPLDALTAGSAAPASGMSSHVLVLAYLAIALGLAVRTIVRRVRLAGALRSASPMHDVAAPCPVVRHDDLGPMVAGVLSPRIVLPAALVDEAPPATLACVVGHEIAHARRRDPWLVAAMEALLVVAWPVAPLWIAAARVRHLIELACDEAALEGADTAERRRYGHVLLDMVDEPPTMLAAAGLHFGSTLRARIEAIALGRPWPRVVQLALVGATVAGFAACASAAPDSGKSGQSGSDQYGYKFDNDTAQNASKVDPVPAERDHGRLPPEVIQNVVRSNFGRFRTCYEQGVARNAKLEGRVTVSYTIAGDGSTQEAADHGSTLPDPDVVKCVVAGFGKLTYPPPDGGIVTVIYPIEFNPGT